MKALNKCTRVCTSFPVTQLGCSKIMTYMNQQPFNTAKNTAGKILSIALFVWDEVIGLGKFSVHCGFSTGGVSAVFRPAEKCKSCGSSYQRTELAVDPFGLSAGWASGGEDCFSCPVPSVTQL